MLSCKDDDCGSLQSAELFYIPDCASINGYFILEENNTTYTFRDELDSKFQKEGVKVMLAFELVDNQLLTTDCFTNQVVQIICIEEN